MIALMTSPPEYPPLREASTPIPAGWYPAPDGSSESWWWDGAQWMQHHPGRPEPSDNAIAKLSTATRVLLLICVAQCVAFIGVEAFGIIAIDGVFGGGMPLEAFDVYLQSSLIISTLSAPCLLATGVLWMIWQHRVAERLSGRTRRSPGWHVGSWLVPIISLWYPYQNISDLWRAVGRTPPAWQIVWWLLWIASGIPAMVSIQFSLSPEDLDAWQSSMWLNIASEALLLAAAPLAWLLVRGITKGVLQQSSAIDEAR